jgi:D-threo-aldose 1-dehydrogenase
MNQQPQPAPENTAPKTATPLFKPMLDGTRLGLGGAPLGNLFTAVAESEGLALSQTAMQDGVRCLDTAPHYGHGLSEQRFGQALRLADLDARGRADFSVSSKSGRLLTPSRTAARDQLNFVNILPFNQHWDYSRAGTRRSVEDSLQRMGLSHLDTVFVHDCCHVCHPDDYPQVLRQVCDEAIPELQRMKSEGLLSSIGIGVNVVQVCLDVLAGAELDAILLAGRYTLLDQTSLAALLPLCASRGVRVAIGGAFNSGILATGVKQDAHEPLFNYERAPAHWVDKTRRIEAVCAAFKVPLRAAALQFPMAHPAIDVVLAGVQTLDQWRDALHMARHAIPAAFWSELKKQGLLPDEAPVPLGH